MGPRVCTLLFLFLTVPAGADDAVVYESLTGVSIGRVFLHPDERAYLDANRGKAPTTTVSAAAEAEGEATAEPTREPAGFISRNGRERRYWQDGDFVRRGQGKSGGAGFPGQVKIIRHEKSPPPEPSAQSTAPDTSEDEDSGNDG